MKLLTRYLLSQYIRYYLTVTVGFIAIYLLIDFIEKIEKFNKAGKSLGLAVNFFALNIPFIIDQLGPVLILLSGVISLGILNHTNELRALKAGGIPLKMIIRPLLIGAAACTFLSFCSAQWLLPVTVAKTNAIWYEQVKGKLQLGIFRNGRYYYKGKDGFYSFEWPNVKTFTFRNFSYSRWNDSFNIASLLIADEASWNEDRKMWELTNAHVQKQEAKNQYSVSNIAYWQASFLESPENFLIPENEAAELSLTELYREIHKKETDTLKNKAWADFLGRLSYLLLGIPLLLLGMPIMMISYQKWGRDLSVAIPASCGLAFLAWGLWGAMQSLAGAGYIPPAFAAGTIHIIFATIGIVLLRKQDA